MVTWRVAHKFYLAILRFSDDSMVPTWQHWQIERLFIPRRYSLIDISPVACKHCFDPDGLINTCALLLTDEQSDYSVPDLESETSFPTQAGQRRYSTSKAHLLSLMLSFLQFPASGSR